MVDGQQMLPAVLEPSDRPSGSDGSHGHERILRIDLASYAEASSDVHGFDPYHLRWEVQYRSQRSPHLMRAFGDPPHRDTGIRVWADDETPGLQREGSVSVNPE